MAITPYKPFEFNGNIILDARRSWKDQTQTEEATTAQSAIQDSKHQDTTEDQLVPQQAHAPQQEAHLSKQEVMPQDDPAQPQQPTVRSPALLLPSAKQQANEAPSTPKVGIRRSGSPGSSRSDSMCSERSTQLSIRAPQREQQQPPLYSVVVAVPYVKNAMLISNFNDSCCWLPISASGAAVDDWVVTEENYISSATLNKKGKASGAGVGGQSSGGIRFRPGKLYIP